MNEENKITIENLPPMSKEEKEFWEEHNNEYYHYLYRIDNKLNGKFYYGIHSEKKKNGRVLGEDNYMGSGLALIKAQEKDGIENFEKTIIKTFSTRDEARLEERIIVNEELVKDPNCYNIILGGGGVGNPGLITVNYRDEKLREDKFFLIPTEEYNNNKSKYITAASNKILVLRKSDNIYISISKVYYEKHIDLYSIPILVNYRDEKLRKNKFFLISAEEYNNNKNKYITALPEKGIYKNITNSNDIRPLDANDPLVLSGQFIGIMKGVKQSKETIQKKLGEKNGSFSSFWITNGKESRKIKNEEIPKGWWKGKVVLNNKRIYKIKCINKDTLEIKYIEKDQIDCITWYPYIFYLGGKIITKEIFLNVVNSSNSWKEVAEKLNTYKDIVEKLRLYYNIPNNTIQNKYNGHKQ